MTNEVLQTGWLTVKSYYETVRCSPTYIPVRTFFKEWEFRTEKGIQQHLRVHGDYSPKNKNDVNSGWVYMGLDSGKRTR